MNTETLHEQYYANRDIRSSQNPVIMHLDHEGGHGQVVMHRADYGCSAIVADQIEVVSNP